MNQTDFIGLALSRFNYNSLRGDASYTEDGMLLVKLKLEGVSPNIDNQRINLNLNIENNLREQLASLRATRDPIRYVIDTLKENSGEP